MVPIAKDFNDDMQDYLDKLYGKKERYVDSVKKDKKKKPVSKEIVPEISEEEVFVEYEDSRPNTGVRRWLDNIFGSGSRKDEDMLLDDLPENEAHVLEDIEEDIEHIDEEIEELEEEREGMMSRFLKKMRKSRSKSEAELKDDLLDEVVPVIDEDVKEVLKILHLWLEKLPNQDLRAFRVSNDFEKYKAVLEKYGLVKKE